MRVISQAGQPYGPKINTPNSFQADSKFGALPHLNSLQSPLIKMEEHHGSCSKLTSRSRIDSDMAGILFPLAFPSIDSQLTEKSSRRTRLLHQFGAEVGSRGAVDVKEVLEAIEFWHRTRGRLLSSGATTIVDVACGHGLAGILYALMESKVERVFCMDRKRPPSHDALLAAAESVLPGSSCKMKWISEDISLIPNDLREAQEKMSQGRLEATSLFTNGLKGGLGIIGVHCCGSLSDDCIDIATLVQTPIAIMPCCYGGTDKGSPLGVRRALGVAVSADVDRSYRLERLGFLVDWSTIPKSVTPMNRIIIALPRS